MNRKILLKFSRIIIIAGLIVPIIILLNGERSYPVSAQTESASARTISQGIGGHADCLACHAKPNMIGKFMNGETVSLSFDASQHVGAIHGNRGLTCQVCHNGQEEYPHATSPQNTCLVCHQQITDNQSPAQESALVFEIPMKSRRDLSLQLNQTCKRCHKTQDKEVVDSDHTRIMEDGNPNAPVCVDCHGFHNVAAVHESRSIVPQICSKCHMAVYTTYKSSVHGAALDEDSNPDVPTCGDCHGTHIVRGPDYASFRANSIVTCGKCHGDKSLMGKYGVSVEVFNTYLNDFHGRAVDYSRKSESLKVDQATCYDCHGVHNIMAPEAETSAVYPANLQHTCQQCHPDANITFPQAWLSHQVPDWNDTPVLFVVTQFYKYFIPLMTSCYGFYILLDARRRIVTRLRKNTEK